MRINPILSAMIIMAITFIISYQNDFQLLYLIIASICSFAILIIIIYKRLSAESKVPTDLIILALLEIIIWCATQQTNKNLHAFQIQILILSIGEQKSMKCLDAIFALSLLLNIIDFRQEQIISVEIGISVFILMFSNSYFLHKYYQQRTNDRKSNLELEQNSRLPLSQFDNSHSISVTKRQDNKFDNQSTNCPKSKQCNEFKMLFQSQKIISIDRNMEVEEVNFEISSYFNRDHQNDENINDFFNLKATKLYDKNTKTVRGLLEEIFESIKQCVVIKIKKQVGCNFKNVYLIVYPLPQYSDIKMIIQLIDIQQSYLKLKEKQKQVLNDTFKSLSHELGTNLNSILTYSTIAINDPNLPQQIYQNYLKPIQINSQHLNLIVSNIRDYNLIKMRQFDLKIEEFRIDQTINHINQLFTDVLREKNIKLNIQILFDSKSVVCDNKRFSQVYFQILSNSIKYTRNEEICVRLQQIQDLIEIVISDGGEGINKKEYENVNKILNQSEFVRVSGKSVGIGMGLGISNEIVKQLNQNTSPIICQQKSIGVQFTFTIKNHAVELNDIGQQSQIEFMSSNSAIRVFSQNLYFEGISRIEMISSKIVPSILVPSGNKDKGKRKSTIKIKADPESYTYQLNDEESFKIQRAPLFITQPLNGIMDCHIQSNCCSRVLLIDDEYFNIQCLTMLLRSHNTICDSAYNGQEALDKIEQKLLNPCKQCSNQHYALIFFDINMPIMDGYECVENVQQWIKEGKIRKCWCVANSGFSDLQTKLKAYQSGMDYYLTKPINPSELEDIIGKMFPLKQISIQY